MTDEAVLLVETGTPIPFRLSAATAIPKGTHMKLINPFMCSISAGSADQVAGIAASEKIAGDGILILPVFDEGYFRVKASGAISVGDPLATANQAVGENVVYSVVATTLDVSGTAIIGEAMEGVADGATLVMKLNPHSVMDPRV